MAGFYPPPAHTTIWVNQYAEYMGKFFWGAVWGVDMPVRLQEAIYFLDGLTDNLDRLYVSKRNVTGLHLH